MPYLYGTSYSLELIVLYFTPPEQNSNNNSISNLITLTCNLCKYDIVSHHRSNLRWLSISSFIRYRSMLTMCDNYYLNKGVALELPILFGIQNSYGTRFSQHFAAITCCRKSFTKRIFDYQAVNWECLIARIFS